MCFPEISIGQAPLYSLAETYKQSLSVDLLTGRMCVVCPRFVMEHLGLKCPRAFNEKPFLS